MSRIDREPSRAEAWLRPVDFFVPPAIRSEGGDARTRARILAATCLFGGVVTASVALSELATRGIATGISIVNVVGGLVILLGAFALRLSGSLVVTANLLLAVGWAMNTVLYVASGGTNVSCLYAYAILPAIAMLFAGPRVGAAWTAAACASVVGLIHAPLPQLQLPVSFAVLDRPSQTARDVVVITIWLALVGALFDLVRSSSQKNAEAARQAAEAARARAEESERRFALFFRANPDGIVMADAATREVLECNESFLELLGLPGDRVVQQGLDWTELLGMSDGQREAVARELAADGARREIEVHLAARDGAGRSLRVRVGPVELEGRPCVLAAVRDVTENARLEAQLRQSQKMEAVGQLAGAIAHDFNNMLTVISGYAESLEDALSGDLGDMAGEIGSAAGRSADLTRQLLAFSRRQVLEPQVFDLNEMARRMEKLLQRLIGEPIRVELDLDPALGHVRADPGQMEQVLVNLAINARDAMPEGGTLRLETARAPGDGARGEQVCLRVRDTGHGMDEATLARVVEPFFTTKEPGKGTGLGLSTVEGIVSQSGGALSIHSRPGEGTCVEIRLPRLPDGHEADPAERSTTGDPETAASGRTVLLVEDDEMVRRLASRSLRAGGCRVVEAGDGEEALAIFLERGDEVDLVLTDMVMPRRGGLELARALRELRPVPVLFMSGYPNPREDTSMELPAGEELIGKPFSPAALRARVAELLARGGPRKREA